MSPDLLRPSGPRTSTPTAGRSCWRAGASWRRCAPGLPRTISSRSRPARLQVSPGNETHLHAFATALAAPDGSAAPLYLRTSPEFACKKLLAAGERRIVEFAKVFRNRERGALHHPEFTLVEWYRAGEPYDVLMADCAAIWREAAERPADRQFTFRGRTADPVRRAGAAHGRRGVRALCRHRSSWRRSQATRRIATAFARAAQAAGIRIADDDSWGDIFSRVLVERIEPNLGIGRATILDEYPAVLAALARPRARSARRRTLRALCLRRRTRQRLWRTDRSRPSSAGGSNRKWRRKSASTASVIRSTRIFSPRSPVCRKRAASRSASTGWSCWRPARRASIRCSGHRSTIRRNKRALHKPLEAFSSDNKERGRPCRQDSKTLRSASALVEAQLIKPERLAALQNVAARYAVAITPALADLIDTRGPARSDRAAICAR